MFDIEENLKKLPDSPGVYIHKDKLGQIIYVGKAISLKNRVRQYFRLSKNADAKVRAMVSHIAEFEYITCATEMEALILENNLIKKHQPKYNILLRDDKTYPYIKVTVNEEYPRILKTRELANDGSKYFGPYSDVKVVNGIIELLNNMFCLKRCSAQKFTTDSKPCLNYHIKTCRGVCGGKVNREEYRKDVDAAVDLLNGKNKKAIEKLTEKMNEAAEEMRFEDAAVHRDNIEALKSITQLQRVTLLGVKDMDVVMALRGAKEQYAVVFFVRDGKLSGRESFLMQADCSDDSRMIVSEFIKQYYVNLTSLPYEILVEAELPDSQLIENYLSEIAGRSVKLTVPQKGDKKALLDLAKRDAVEMTKSIDERHIAQQENLKKLNDDIYDVVKPFYPSFERKVSYRIESYDISNTNGVDTVGAMVVFEGMMPIKKDYRRFKIKSVKGQDDYGSLREVIERRFERAINQDASFIKIPDMLLIDGGKGQISVVSEALEELSRKHNKDLRIPIVGMAKDDKHRTRAAVICDGVDFHETELVGKPMLFKYMGRIQEEVHRFAIEYHRTLRGKKVIGSVLDKIEGIGPKKRNALLNHFKSVENIKKATIEELMQIDIITEKNAEAIKEYFNC